SANRGRSELEGLIGFFVNTLPIRVELAGAPTVAQLLERVKSRSLGAQQNQDLPFERVVELAQPSRVLSYSPLFQVVLAWQSAPRGSVELPGLTLGAVDAAAAADAADGVPAVSAKYDLSLGLGEVGGRIVGNLRYATSLFDHATVERWLGYLRSVLQAMAADDGQRVDLLPLLPPAEHRQLVDGWNQTARPYPRQVTIHETFARQVAERPDDVALVWEGERLTYAELDARANRLANHLVRHGVGTESRVGVLMERGTELIVSTLAILKAGGCYVPLDPAYPAERLSLMLADAGARVLVTRGDAAVAAEGVRAVSLDGDARAIAAESAEAPANGATAENLAYIVYTSGSTGTPKGVMVSHRNVVQLVIETDFVQLRPGDRVGQASSASFDALTFEEWGALLNGATLVGISRDVLLSPDALRTLLREERVTTLFQTTALVNQLSAAHPDIFASLREVLFGGQQVDADAVRRLLRSGKPGRLLHVYGPTETTTFCLCGEVETVGEDARNVDIGGPIGNARVYLLDGSMQPVPVGVLGEAYVGGGGVARGYLGRPSLTAQRFVPDPFSPEPGARMYRTGDQMRRTAGGRLEFVGRLDEQVKIRGFRIEPGEVESLLAARPEVREVRVVVREDQPGEKRLVAYLVGDADAEALRASLRATLPEYMLPSAFVTVDRLPLTPNGKLDVRALPVPELATAEALYVAPRTVVEEALAAIWAEVLRVDRVGATDDFFALGGHSLLIMRLTARVQATFGLELSIRTVFSQPTLEGMAAEIERMVYADILEMTDEQAEELAGMAAAAGGAW
ncbi:MAG TPA: amino acid adenylation domain-containing protein, partial [Longimicrobium sp.]|nr:amino acid adenylation domain-containing protein [Longimicrobium sp.]